MENFSPGVRQVLTFSIPPTQEEHDRLAAALKEAVARNDGKPLACLTALAKWHVAIALRALQDKQ